MPCDWITADDGAVIHINRGRSRSKSCPFCKTGKVSKLCDFPVSEGKTCDAEMCDCCATHRGFQNTVVAPGIRRMHDTIDVCPNHKEPAK